MEDQIVFFLNTSETPEVSCLTVWDALKAYLRGQIILYTANMKRKAYKERKDLTNQIKEIDQQYAPFKNPDLYKKRIELQTNFELISTHVIECQLLKSRSQFYIHGDKSGKLLANQSKAQQHITKIRMEDGTITTDHSKINDAFRNFYSRLYTSEFPKDCNSLENFLNQLDIPTLFPDSRLRLEFNSIQFNFICIALLAIFIAAKQLYTIKRII